jgi:cytochrome c oxidase assembly protein subunit 15
LIVVAQVCLGGWTTSNYAALACPDFPTCHYAWVPEMDFAEGFDIFQHIGPNYLGGVMDNTARVAIHFTHRMGALVTTLYLGFLAWKLFGAALPETRRMAKIVLGALVVQLLLGIGNIVLDFPLAVAVAHNLGGALLLLTIVTLNHRVFTAQPR